MLELFTQIMVILVARALIKVFVDVVFEECS